MFTKSAAFYDAIYSWKDYTAEADLVVGYARQYKRSGGDSLLDVACGTGQHLQYLRDAYQVEGLDLDPELLKIARERLPDVAFHQANMIDFELGKRFDIITCLFSSIGYVKTVDHLNLTLFTLAKHLQPGGVLLVEPWFAPDKFHGGLVHAVFVDQPDLKVARMNISRIEGRLSFLDFHYLVATPAGVEHFTELHELGLFSDAEYRAAFAAAGLETHHDAEGLDGRGLYIGVQKR